MQTIDDIIREVTPPPLPANLDARYVGGLCERCGLPRATQTAWDELGEDEGEGLCWGDCKLWMETYTPGQVLLLAREIVRLRAKVAELESEQQWAAHYHAKAVELRDAIKPLLDVLAWQARTNSGLAAQLADVERVMGEI